MAEDKQKLEELSNYVGGLWKLGGLPLALIGVGAVNIIIPTTDISPYSENESLIVTIFLFTSAVAAWSFTIYLAYLRWQTTMEVNQNHDSTIIEASAKIAIETENANDAVQKIEALHNTLENLGIHKLGRAEEERNCGKN